MLEIRHVGQNLGGWRRSSGGYFISMGGNGIYEDELSGI
jgi:hypothetical protein